MITEPKTSDLIDQYLAQFETRLSKTFPSTPKSFIRVMATTLAMMQKSNAKLATERTNQVLALTASGADLDRNGREIGVVRDPAVAAQIEVTTTGTAGTFVPIGASWTSDATGAYYTANATYYADAGVITMILTAEDTGDAANLDNGETLTIGTPIAGVGSAGTVTDTTVEGEDEETDVSYRRRVLAEWRNVGGGGNAADYRRWGEEPSGIARIYPYSGKPITWQVLASDHDATISFAAVDSSINCASIDFTDMEIFGSPAIGCVIVVSGSANNNGQYTVQSCAAHKIVVVETIIDEGAGADVELVNLSLPGDRTIYVEAFGTVDGVPTQTMLDAVRAAITAGSDGVARPPLGEIDDTLYVEPIRRTPFKVTVQNLQVDPALAAATEEALETALTTYFEACEPYCQSLDFEMDRTDIMTNPTVAVVVQDVLKAMGATADGVLFAVDGGDDYLPSYQLRQGEKAKFASLTTT